MQHNLNMRMLLSTLKESKVHSCCLTLFPWRLAVPGNQQRVSPDSTVLCKSRGGGVHTGIQTETQKPHEDPTRQAGREHRTVRGNRHVHALLQRPKPRGLPLDLACTSSVVLLAKRDKLEAAFTMSSLINPNLYSQSTHDGFSLCVHKT